MYLPFTILLPFVFTILSPYFVSLTHSKVARLESRPFYIHPEKLSDVSAKIRHQCQALGWIQSQRPYLSFLGEEASIESDLYVGFFQDNGPRLKALLVYIEHRYYGKSVPFGSAEEALKNASTLGYLNGAQALSLAKNFKTCAEIMMPIGHDKHDTMFQTAPFNMTSAIDNCKSSYGVSPRPHWVTTYFGIQDVKLILRRFGSNIIFSNGLADPYSVGGVLEDVSDSIVAIKTLKGTHSQDLSTRRKDDPEWLVMQREKEIKIIESWISTYQKDLRGLNMS
uniref:Uncharacterized protein n=1 Tax=Brassica campestris TaxID=3711 RepID=M4DUM8_BRACM